MPAAWWLGIVPSISVHAAAFAIVMFGGDVFHRAHAVPPEDRKVIAPATMRAWLPPALPPASSAPQLVVEADLPPSPRLRRTGQVGQQVVVKSGANLVKRGADLVKRGADLVVKSGADLIGPRAPEPQPAPFDPLAFVPPPSASSIPAVPPAPADDNVSVLFVGIENGEWLRWLGERHGFVGFTTRRDDVIEHVYSVSGELQSTSSVAVANLWALELSQAERVTAIADMLARERERRERAGESDARIRVFALFPASFRDEVAAAIHRAGGTGGVLVSFSGNELQVAASAPAAQPTH